MAENGNSSFIPRQTAAPTSRRRSRRGVGLFGYASYIIFVGSLLAGGGMFFYSQYIQIQLSEKQTELEEVKNQFDQTEMNRVQEFESFLSTVSTLYQRSIVVNKIFTTIEESIAQGAVFSSLQIERGPEELSVTAEVSADSFDTALFQRSVYEEYPLLSSFSIENVVLADSGSPSGEGSGTSVSEEVSSLLAQAGSDLVTFSLTFAIPASELSFTNAEDVVDELESSEEVLFDEDTEGSAELDSETDLDETESEAAVEEEGLEDVEETNEVNEDNGENI